MGEINVVIGSWGSYTSNNERALGSKWICFNNYDSWEEIAEQLEKEGFKLCGIDAELFIQDIEGIGGFNCDYMNPETLFNICKEAEILDDDYKYKVAIALIEALGWDDFKTRVEHSGSRWDEDVYFYENMTIEEALQEMVESSYPELDFSKLGWIGNYVEIDYERMARDSGNYHEVENGCIEVW